MHEKRKYENTMSDTDPPTPTSPGQVTLRLRRDWQQNNDNRDHTDEKKDQRKRKM